MSMSQEVWIRDGAVCNANAAIAIPIRTPIISPMMISFFANFM